MKRALFVTTTSNEMPVVVQAWRDYMGSAAHVTFFAPGPPNDETILACAEGFRPDVIIYSGANAGAGLPAIATLQRLRGIAKSVHYQGDLEDDSWRPVLQVYRDNGCFDLCSAQTGVHAPLTDYATLTAISAKPYGTPPVERDLRCGFIGNFQSKEQFETVKRLHKTEEPRSAILHALGRDVYLKRRVVDGGYSDYVEFLLRCRIMLNTSYTGSGEKHHVKGRVVEAGLAGCALLECRESPTKAWFPADCFFTYGSVAEARQIIAETPRGVLIATAEKLRAHVLEHYSPAKIYGDMLNRLGIA